MLDPVSIVDRSPEWFRSAVYRMASGRGFAGRVADAIRFRYRSSDIPTLPAVSGARIRVVIGPTNSAGQGYQWARTLERRLPDTTALSMYGVGSNPFLTHVDLGVPVAVYQRSAEWHDAFERFLGQHSHVIWESGHALLGRKYRSEVQREISVLQDGGVKAALMFHGSDIRPPSLHAAHSGWSPFGSVSGRVRALEEGAARNARLVADSGVPVFVSTPDLLRWVPGASWCPVVIEVSRWASRMATPPRARPVVVHAPTQRWLKGTDLIEPMLRRLDAEGTIEYRQVVNVPHDSMPEFYSGSDVVLDQFRLGSYGVAACEAMASGRLVMGHIDRETRAFVRERTGMGLPIHEATVESLESELRRAASDPDAFEAQRAAGPAFVERVHGGGLSADALATFVRVD